MNNLLLRVQFLPLLPRLCGFYGAFGILSLLYVFGSEASWMSLITGSLMLGSAAAAAFHHFRPYTYVWSRIKAGVFRFVHAMLTLSVVYLCLWGRFLEYGALVGEDVSWPQRVSGILIAALGYLTAGIWLGKGRFEPPPEVLTSTR